MIVINFTAVFLGLCRYHSKFHQIQNPNANSTLIDYIPHHVSVMYDIFPPLMHYATSQEVHLFLIDSSKSHFTRL